MNEKNNQEKVVEIKKDDSKKFGRFTKIAGIIAIVFFSSYLLIQTNLTIMSWFEGKPLSMLDQWTSEMFVFLFGGLLSQGAVAFMTISFSLTYSILCVIFACKVLTFSSKTLDEAYARSNSMIAYAIIFGIWIIVPISILIEAAIPIFILAIALIILIDSFIIVDIVNVNREYNKQNGQNATILNVSNVEDELNKLEELKNNNKITEDEYNTLRKRILG